MEYMDLGLKRPVNLLLTIMDKVLMFMGYVYKGLRPVTLIPINQVTKVYFCVYLLILVVLKKTHCDERFNSSGNDGRRGFRSQETSHSYLQNKLESVEDDGRGVYRSQTRLYTYHNQGGIGILLGFYDNGNARSGNRSQTIQITSYNHGELYMVRSRFPPDAISRGSREENIQNINQGCFLYPNQNHPYNSYPIMRPHPHPNIPSYSNKRMLQQPNFLCPY